MQICSRSALRAVHLANVIVEFQRPEKEEGMDEVSALIAAN